MAQLPPGFELEGPSRVPEIMERNQQQAPPPQEPPPGYAPAHPWSELAPRGPELAPPDAGPPKAAGLPPGFEVEAGSKVETPGMATGLVRQAVGGIPIIGP